MNRREFTKLMAATAAGLVTGACGGGDSSGMNPPPPPGGGGGTGDITKIEHIVFTMQENRSFDHYFGRMPVYRNQHEIPGDVDGVPADASNPSFDNPSKLITPYHLATECHENLSPGWNESHRQWNRSDPSSSTPTLDGFVYSAANYSRETTEQAVDFQGLRAMGYYDWNDIPYYYALASKFAMSDRHFCSVLATTEPNRMYLIGATSEGHIRPLKVANGDTQLTGRTIFDLLDDAGITWKIYLANKSDPKSFTYWSMFKSSRGKNDPHVVDAEQFFTDCQNGALPQVAMLESGVNTGMDEHPTAQIQSGAAYIAKAFNAFMKGPLWTKSAMFLTYDEAGGFYDHVAPPTAVAPDNIAPRLLATDTPGDFDRYGFRVPLIAVSPFVKPNYVSHQVSDHTSILKFIEKRFNLPNLTQRDKNAVDLTDMFDFTTMAIEQPPSMPTQPTGGTCNFSLVDNQ